MGLNGGRARAEDGEDGWAIVRCVRQHDPGIRIDLVTGRWQIHGRLGKIR